MSSLPIPPRTIARVAARRTFETASKQRVVLTIGVPEKVGRDYWGALVRVSGAEPSWARPRFVFGADSLQALHLAMQFGTQLIEAVRPRLSWLGGPELLLPRSLPYIGGPAAARIEALIDRELSRDLARREQEARRTGDASDSGSIRHLPGQRGAEAGSRPRSGERRRAKPGHARVRR